MIEFVSVSFALKVTSVVNFGEHVRDLVVDLPCILGSDIVGCVVVGGGDFPHLEKILDGGWF